MNNEMENAIATLKKYHDLLLEVYADYSVYSKAENYSDKSLELASRANAVRNAVGTAIACIERQLNNGWIPVSERLPEATDRYLVTYHEWSDGVYLPKFNDIYVRIWRYKIEPQYTGWVYPTCLDMNAEKDTHREVLAWQPLPEPYKEADTK